jgi:hypothetical protein
VGPPCQREGEEQTPPAREEEEAQPTEEKKPACDGSKPSRTARLASPPPEPQAELPLRA